jgi:hypothetical protein
MGDPGQIAFPWRIFLPSRELTLGSVGLFLKTAFGAPRGGMVSNAVLPSVNHLGCAPAGLYLATELDTLYDIARTQAAQYQVLPSQLPAIAIVPGTGSFKDSSVPA